MYSFVNVSVNVIHPSICVILSLFKSIAADLSTPETVGMSLCALSLHTVLIDL